MDHTYFSGTLHSMSSCRTFTYTGTWWRLDGEVHWKALIESEGQPSTAPEGVFKVPYTAPGAGVRRAVRDFIEALEKKRSLLDEGDVLARFSRGDIVAVTVGGVTREGRIAAMAPDFASAAVELDRPQGERREHLLISATKGALASIPGASSVKIRRGRSKKVTS